MSSPLVENAKEDVSPDSKKEYSAITVGHEPFLEKYPTQTGMNDKNDIYMDSEELAIGIVYRLSSIWACFLGVLFIAMESPWDKRVEWRLQRNIVKVIFMLLHLIGFALMYCMVWPSSQV
ncbi:uncharacterized protein LOC144700406 [Wolffia australiana]